MPVPRRQSQVWGCLPVLALLGCAEEQPDAAPALVEVDCGTTNDVASSPSLAIDAGAVYWLDDDQLLRQSRCEGTPSVLATTSTGSIARVAVTDTDVVWIENGVVEGPSLRRLPLDGGNVANLGDAGMYLLSTFDHFVYFERRGVDGTTQLIEVDLAANSERVIPGPSGALAVAVLDTEIIGTDCGEVWKMPRTGGEPTVLAAADGGALCPLGVAVDGDLAYFDAALPESGVYRLTLAGGSPELVGAPTTSDVFHRFVVRRGVVYALDDGKVLRTTVDGSTAEVAETAPLVEGIAVGDQVVYWTERATVDEPLVLRSAELYE